MSSVRIHTGLDAGASERALAALPVDAPGRADAEKAVVGAREEYLGAIRLVAEELGSSGMPDLTEPQMHRLEYPGTDADPGEP